MLDTGSKIHCALSLHRLLGPPGTQQENPAQFRASGLSLKVQRVSEMTCPWARKANPP